MRAGRGVARGGAVVTVAAIDRAFRAALLPLPCPDRVRWLTVPHVVSLADGYWEIATDGPRMHARRVPAPPPGAGVDAKAARIRAVLDATFKGRAEQALEISAEDLVRAHDLDAALGKRWNAALDLSTGAVYGFHAGPSRRKLTLRDLARRESVLGGPVLAGACAPHPGAPACYVRLLLDAVAHAETLTVHFVPGDGSAPLRLASADGARWAVVMPCRVYLPRPAPG
jgi:hypothetical protein